MSSRPLEAAASQRFSVLAEALETRIEQIVSLVLAQARQEIPPEWFADRPELDGYLRQTANQSILAELRAFQDGARLPETCPSVDAEFAKKVAQLGAPLSNLLWGYRAGHAAQWQTWFELVEEQGLEGAQRRQLLERGSRFFFDYANRVSDFATREYTHERERALRDYEQRRVQLVRELLDGSTVESAALDYAVDAHHIGVIGWGPDAVDAVRELAGVLRRRLLIVSLLEDTWWAWLGADRALSDGERQALRRYRPRSNARLAIGREGEALAGFRRTHHDAGFAHRAGLRRSEAVTLYEQIALEALAGQNEPEAAAFVAQELAGIDGEDDRSRELRDTVSAYFAAAHNAAATAAALGVHEQTVTNRLRAVEQRLGQPVTARRAEIETALRLRSYLGSPPPAAERGGSGRSSRAGE